ncbi:MAG: hypothetical protein A2521_14550 [Deltaproteobacteria bacterium RIFOXYD12_FULL_57_12]|nr:MAG: hypothetical protein A2521_14550 [Deltaproteobacteria bacterium RIFOXYD12_FULL_57_12]
MNRLTQLIDRYGTKTLLLWFAAVLLVVNLGRYATLYFQNQQAELESRVTLLGQHQISAGKLAGLKARVATLVKQKEQMDSFLFEAKSVEEAASSMQIAIQEQLTAAGLVLETLKPSFQKNSEQGKTIGEIEIKVRFAGSLNEFSHFLAGLYQSKKLFQMESFTLKPSRDTKLTIFLELRGFYRIPQEK